MMETQTERAQREAAAKAESYKLETQRLRATLIEQIETAISLVLDVSRVGTIGGPATGHLSTAAEALNAARDAMVLEAYYRDRNKPVVR